MVDLSDFRRTARAKGSCRYSTVRDTLGEEDQAKLDAAMADFEISNPVIRQWLVARSPLTLHTESVRRHRNKVCGCHA